MLIISLWARINTATSITWEKQQKKNAHNVHQIVKSPSNISWKHQVWVMRTLQSKALELFLQYWQPRREKTITEEWGEDADLSTASVERRAMLDENDLSLSDGDNSFTIWTLPVWFTLDSSSPGTLSKVVPGKCVRVDNYCTVGQLGISTTLLCLIMTALTNMRAFPPFSEEYSAPHKVGKNRISLHGTTSHPALGCLQPPACGLCRSGSLIKISAASPLFCCCQDLWSVLLTVRRWRRRRRRWWNSCFVVSGADLRCFP